MSAAQTAISVCSLKLSRSLPRLKESHQGAARRYDPQARSQTLVLRCVGNLTFEVFLEDLDHGNKRDAPSHYF
jgi:hypothetical protein